MSVGIAIELRGPDFLMSAIEMSHTLPVKFVCQLNIYNLTSATIRSLQGALLKLRTYFTADAVVMVTTMQNLPSNTTALLKTAAGGVSVEINHVSFPINNLPAGPQEFGLIPFLGQFNQANNAALFQRQAVDMQEAITIFQQVATDTEKQRAERWKIMQDTQTKIFEITQDVTVNKAKSADKAFNAMDGYIRH